MSEWEQLRWGDIASLQYGRGLSGYQDRVGKVEVFGTNGPIGWTDDAQSEGPGVIIGRKGAYRGVHYSHGPFWVIDTAYFLKPIGVLDLRWAYYAIKIHDINSLDSGSAIPSTSRADFYSLRVAVPSLREQHAIGELLGCLDDKISVNQRISEAALLLADACYEIVSSRGGWREMALGDAARWLSGGTPRTDDPSFWNGHIPWISAASLKSPWIDGSNRCLTAIGAQNGTRMVPKDTVICIVRGMSLKTEFRVGITQREVAFGQDCKALVPGSDVSPSALFHGIRFQIPQILNLVDEAGHGTGRLATDRLERVTVRMPPDRHDAAIARLEALDRLAARRQRESEDLVNLRDALLAALLSGDIRIPDVEKIIEEAT